MKKDNKVTIKIPRPLYNQLKDLTRDTGFNSVTDFIVWVLRDVASGGKLDQLDRLSAKEVELIRQRLKNLGYL
ncbi:CopG family transcriptional regulator [bacterium]|nr:CopG family transcriptional regulator [bacterium]